MWVGSARVQMGRNDVLRIGRGSGCVLFDGDMSDLLGAYSDSAWRRATTPAEPGPLPSVALSHCQVLCAPGRATGASR